MMKDNGDNINDHFVDIRDLFQKIHGVTRKRRLIRKESLNKVVKKRKVGRRGEKVRIFTKLRVNGKPFKPHKEPPLPLFTGYLCGSCRDVRWILGDSGWYYLQNKNEWYCPPCGVSYGRELACPICGLCFSEDDSDDASNWIQCDVCSRWIMSSCDGIEDISVYDDDNPDHIEYSCPMCQGRMEDEPLIFKTKVKKKKEPKQRDSYRKIIKNTSSLETDMAKVEKTIISGTNKSKSKTKERLKKSQMDILLRTDMSSIRKIFTSSVDLFTQQNEELMENISENINTNNLRLERETEDILMTFLEDISIIQNPYNN